MSIICDECEQEVVNPFYTIHGVLVDRVNKKIATTNQEVVVCQGELNKLERLLVDSTSQFEAEIGIIVYRTEGIPGGTHDAIQLTRGTHHTDQGRYLDMHNAREKFPEIVEQIYEAPLWTEELNGKQVESFWARDLYAQLRK